MASCPGTDEQQCRATDHCRADDNDSTASVGRKAAMKEKEDERVCNNEEPVYSAKYIARHRCRRVAMAHEEK